MIPLQRRRRLQDMVLDVPTQARKGVKVDQLLSMLTSNWAADEEGGTAAAALGAQ